MKPLSAAQHAEDFSQRSGFASWRTAGACLGGGTWRNCVVLGGRINHARFLGRRRSRPAHPFAGLRATLSGIPAAAVACATSR